MIVYVVFEESYDESHVCTVTDTREKAEMLVERFQRGYPVVIQEYDTDEFNSVLRNEYRCFACFYDGSLSIQEIECYDLQRMYLDKLVGDANECQMHTFAKNFGEAEEKFLVQFSRKTDW